MIFCFHIIVVCTCMCLCALVMLVHFYCVYQHLIAAKLAVIVE